MKFSPISIETPPASSAATPSALALNIPVASAAEV